MAAHYRGDDFLEKGVIAELRGKPNPAMFRSALSQFQIAAREMAALDGDLAALQAIAARGKEDPAFADALARILKDAPPVERVSLSGRRYSNITSTPPMPARAKPGSLADIIA